MFSLYAYRLMATLKTGTLARRKPKSINGKTCDEHIQFPPWAPVLAVTRTIKRSSGKGGSGEW